MSTDQPIARDGAGTTSRLPCPDRRGPLPPALALLVTLLAAAGGWPAPVVRNPSFETDAYLQGVGYARQNGGKLTGWSFTGNVGLNPVRRPGGKPQHFFSDNAKLPHGRQVAFLHNVATLSQQVEGFEKGHRYRVTYYENARHNNAPDRNPRLRVTLGGQVLVSEHALRPVEPLNVRTLPFNFVESAVFTAPTTGAFELKFESTYGDRVAVLIDQVTVVELDR